VGRGHADQPRAGAAARRRHLVSGHVDGLAEILAREDIGETTRFTFRVPGPLAKFIAVKGSVCLDGTSLTVNTVDGDTFSVLLIPHTLHVTTWGGRQAGDRVHLEIDQMARYVARLAEAE
jgi:riboflavin synthase